MKKKTFSFVFIFLSIGLQAQIDLDSLWRVWIDETKEDTSRLKALDRFIDEGFLDKQNDSVLYFAQIQYEFASENGSKEFSANALNNLGRAYEGKGELSEARYYFQRSYELYKEIGDLKSAARSLYEIGSVNWTAGEYEIAKDYHRKSLAIACDIDDQERAYLCLNGIAYCYFQQGQFETAIQYVHQSLRISEQIEDDYGIAWAMNAMGVFYSHQGNQEKALEYYLKGLEINERTGDQISISYSLRNIGGVYSDQGNDEMGLKYMERSLEIDEELKDKRGIANSVSNIGYLYLKTGRKKKAMEYFQRGLALSRELGNRDMECESLRDIGLVQMDQGNYKLGISNCQKSYEIALEIGSVVDQLEACDCLYRSNKALGKYALALAFHEEMLVLEDSIKTESLANNLQQMEFARQVFADSLKHEEENLKIELAHQLELSKKDRANTIFTISGLLILIITIALWTRMRFVRKANARLKKEKDRAERSEQFKQQFLANMSHEIRTPMNAIKGMSDILMRRKPKANQKKYLESIRESANSLLIIINDILDLSKIEVGKVDLEHLPFSISEIIKNVHTMMQFKAEEKGLQLNSDIPDDLPLVIGDSTRLRQVLINLLSNAVKFTEKGVVTSSLKIEDLNDGSAINAHFTISDTGIGIDADKIEQVFNSFEQAYADTSRKFGGTGLGLSISRKLIELQNGKIWVESKKGMGSQFRFILPYKVCNENDKIESDSGESSIESIRDQLKGVRVLLAEDNAFNAVVAQEELEDAIKETKVLVAENGAIAVELISHNDFDVVLMDVQMPVMNGYEATESIRVLGGEKSQTPIIAMTANVLKEEVELCYKSGMNDFIGKPFDTDVLIQKIHKLTHNNS